MVCAQQKPQYTQYVFNSLLFNPALSGIENYTDVKAGYRNQWTGLQGAPQTSYLSLSAPLGSDFLYGDATEMPASGGDDPMSRQYSQYYQAAAPHHGIGFTLVSDKAGPITATNIDATYAYHIGITSKLNLSLGVAAGVSRTNLNTSELSLENAFDPAVDNASNAQWNPDLGVGIWAYSSDYFVGISAQQVLPQKLYFSTNIAYDQSKTTPHYYFTAGYKLFMSDDVALLPSFLIIGVKPVPVSYAINMKVSFKDVLWIGGSYRKDDSFGVLAGFNISSLINVGYSYDITTSALNTVSYGSHEIVLSLLLNNRYKVTCPQHTF